MDVQWRPTFVHKCKEKACKHLLLCHELNYGSRGVGNRGRLWSGIPDRHFLSVLSMETVNPKNPNPNIHKPTISHIPFFCNCPSHHLPSLSAKIKILLNKYSNRIKRWNWATYEIVILAISFLYSCTSFVYILHVPLPVLVQHYTVAWRKPLTFCGRECWKTEIVSDARGPAAF